MILGIMQPYFFPYLGYFDLIDSTDRWVVFDCVQYSAKSWMSRNRILHPSRGWQYVNVPVRKSKRGTLIREIRVKDIDGAQQRMLGQLEHYRKHAPYFRTVVDLVRATFADVKSDRLVDLNVSSQERVCACLGIASRLLWCSDLDLDVERIEHPGQWALMIAAQLNAREYVNPSGGKGIFRADEWEEAGITLRFADQPAFSYDCAPYEFIANLSILDVLMWNEPAAVMAAMRGGRKGSDRGGGSRFIPGEKGGAR